MESVAVSVNVFVRHRPGIAQLALTVVVVASHVALATVSSRVARAHLTSTVRGLVTCENNSIAEDNHEFRSLSLSCC